MRLNLLIALGAAGALTMGVTGANAASGPDGSQYGRTTQVRLTGNGLEGGVTNGGVTMPQPCWYEPSDSPPGRWYYDNDELTDERKRNLKKAKKGEGQWWALTYGNGGVDCGASMDSWYYALDEEGPPPLAIDLEQLAWIAREALTVPQHDVRVNPTSKSLVNMDTWVWATGIGATRRHVTASLDALDISVTVTATIQDLDIKSGTTSDRASVKENCGPKGYAYKKGAPFRCGVTYLRSSADQPSRTYTLLAETTWNITSTVELGFEPIVLSASEAVPVDEVQAITE